MKENSFLFALILWPAMSLPRYAHDSCHIDKKFSFQISRDSETQQLTTIPQARCFRQQPSAYGLGLLPSNVLSKNVINFLVLSLSFGYYYLKESFVNRTN